MPHKINELNGSAAGAAPSVGTSRTAGSPAADASAVPGTAETAGGAGEVHITDTAARLALLEPALREAPAVDAARVAAIRTAIEAGQYRVQPEHVATQLLQIEQALAQLRGGSATPASAAPDSTDPA